MLNHPRNPQFAALRMHRVNASQPVVPRLFPHFHSDGYYYGLAIHPIKQGTVALREQQLYLRLAAEEIRRWNLSGKSTTCSMSSI